MIALLRIRIIQAQLIFLIIFPQDTRPKKYPSDFRPLVQYNSTLSSLKFNMCTHTLILSQETSSTYSGSSSGRSAAGSGSSGSGSGYCPSNAGSSDSGRSQGRYHGIPGPAYGGMYGDPRDKGKWNSEFSSISTVISLCH